MKLLRDVLTLGAAVLVMGTVVNTGSASAEPVAVPAAEQVVGSEPVEALAGSFTWGASFKARLESRRWSQGGGSTKITSYADCSGDPGLTTYTIQLFKDQFVDKAYTKVSYECFRELEYTWTGLPSGTYYFVLQKRYNGQTISANGKTEYP